MNTDTIAQRANAARQGIDGLVRFYTAFPTATALFDACRTGYVPTITDSEVASWLLARACRVWNPATNRNW